MGFVMNTDMVYQYPIWAVGLLVVGAAMFGAVLADLHRLGHGKRVSRWNP